MPAVVVPPLAYIDANTALWIQVLAIMVVFACVLVVRPRGQ